jgi:polysaccharide biosynthesis transport protein
MSQEENFSFSEMRRKREAGHGGVPANSSSGAPGNYYGQNPVRPGALHSASVNVHGRPTPHHDAAKMPGFGIRDFYYILFRHKWKIILVFLAGILAALGFYSVKPPLFQSEAKILIRYVLEARATATGSSASGAGDAQIRSPDAGGENIINSEIEILTSLDLAEGVADMVGPEKILARLGGGSGDGKDNLRAAAVIRSGLKVEAPRRTSVLRIIFSHPDPALVQPILNALLETYLKRHVQIHQGVGMLDDFFKRQAEQLSTRLTKTEEELKKLKSEAQIISLDDDRRGYIEQISKIQADMLTTEAELAERHAALTSLMQSAPTNAHDAVAQASVSPEIMQRYCAAAAELNSLEERRAELRARYWDDHFLVRGVNSQIAEVEAAKRKLEEDEPTLTRLPVALPSRTNQTVDLATEALRAATLEARINVLVAQLAKVRADANRVANAEPSIIQLERAREVDAANYRYYTTKLEQMKMEESRKSPNIDVVQTPSPPVRDMDKVMKPLLMIMMMGCFGGFVWGFVSDRFLNRTIKGVVDIERHLPIPLFISVPDMAWQHGVRLPDSSRENAPLLTQPIPTDGDSATMTSGTAVAPWDAGHKLRPYYEGLRDRLITYFEVRDMRHKPKMVAVTSCDHGAGVTTMASGLAAALSETGDGKVLLVDMNLERGAAHPFYQGKPGCALSDALDDATREQAFVQEGLYLVSATEQPKNRQLPSVLPKRFANLVPKMKASDYDYIIFDMPPVTQTSVTARLAGYMDMVLMVVESEKTGQEILKRAHGLLKESDPNMAAVLNKHRAYVPAKFAQGL